MRLSRTAARGLGLEFPRATRLYVPSHRGEDLRASDQDEPGERPVLATESGLPLWGNGRAEANLSAECLPGRPALDPN